MKTFYLLVADQGWAKLYKCDHSPAQLTLIYHQRNLTGRPFHAHELLDTDHEQAIRSRRIEDEDFAKSLCKVLKADFQAHKFDALVVFSSGDFIELIQRNLDAYCRGLVLGEIVSRPGLLAQQDLVTRTRLLVRQQLLSGASTRLAQVRKIRSQSS